MQLHLVETARQRILTATAVAVGVHPAATSNRLVGRRVVASPASDINKQTEREITAEHQFSTGHCLRCRSREPEYN